VRDNQIAKNKGSGCVDIALVRKFLIMMRSYMFYLADLNRVS